MTRKMMLAVCAVVAALSLATSPASASCCGPDAACCGSGCCG